MDADKTSSKFASRRGSLTIEVAILLGALVLILATAAKHLGGSEAVVAPPSHRAAASAIAP